MLPGGYPSRGQSFWRSTLFSAVCCFRWGLACAPCGTACTDGERLVFDPAFVGKLTDRELKFVLLHEVLHCVLNHVIRGKALHALLYNIACDIVVNSLILQMWGLNDEFKVNGQEVMHLAPDGREGYELQAEEIYQMLLRENEEGWQVITAADGIGCIDRHDLWDKIGDAGQFKSSWDDRIRKSANMPGAGAGMTPTIRRLVKDLQRSTRTDWRQILQDFIRYEEYDYTFQPPDRRYMDQDILLPAFNLDKWNGTADKLWVCVDTSASVGTQELTEAMSEILDAVDQVNLKGMVSFFDRQVSEPQPFYSIEDLKKIRPVGGGGTDFYAIFRYLGRYMMEDPPRGILIFTDGYASCPPEYVSRGIPVLWLISEGGDPNLPWGMVVKIHTE